MHGDAVPVVTVERLDDDRQLERFKRGDSLFHGFNDRAVRDRETGFGQ